MTISVWRIAADTPDYTADDLSGKGAEVAGGRWNRKGTPVVYTSTNIALACLETVVHLNTGGLPLNRYLVEIKIPDAVWGARRVPPVSSLPVGWDASPPGLVSLNFGDAWLASKRSTLLQVPSVIIPEENNVLINPLHGSWVGAQIAAVKRRRWLYDARVR
ncbi:MAG TPA: RES family NAD+ phosphorylase [Candidatus Krumholzibacteria bacterium]|jgi:RES domain-containing protein